jgi:signal recognition particle subunit SRP54
LLETLSRGFGAARERLAGIRELTEQNVDEALREVRSSLLEADVDFALVRKFLARVKQRALGEKVATRVRDASGRELRVTPGQHFIAVCEQELVALMGPVDAALARDARGVTSIMLLGLQGVGKTTVAAKLARQLQRERKRPLLVAADPYRPAAVLQLQRLGESLGVPVQAPAAGESPPELCAAAAARAAREGFDAIVYDTAGRLAVDDELMAELEAIRARVAPANTLLVCDALMGRDAVNVAQTFAARLPLDGLVLTKLDGDARGGAALAVKAATGVPIKFLGTGEALDRLEPFRPEGLASRILGMGDVVGLVRDFEGALDEQEAARAEADAERMLAGKLSLEDFLGQLKWIRRMGPLKEVFARLPMMGPLADQLEGDELSKTESMVQSMTRLERRRPELIDKSRAARIAAGSGRRPREVRDLVDRFVQMRDLMGQLGGGGLLGRIPGLGRLAGAGAGGPDLAHAMGALGAAGGSGSGGYTRRQDRDKKKKKRKDAKKARKKSRRR